MRIPLCLCLACVCVHAGDLGAPIPVGADLGALDTFACIIDMSGNPIAAMTTGGKLYFTRGQDTFGARVEIGALDARWKTAPVMSVDATGSTYVAFWLETSPDTYEVAWTSNPGGLFKAPVLVPGSATTQPMPLAFGFAKSGIYMGWSTGDGKVFVSFDGGSPEQIAEGNQASFRTDRAGGVHVVYARGGDVFYSNNMAGLFQGRERALTQSSTLESAPLLALASDAFPFVIYRAEENGTVRLYLTGGTFGTRRVIANGVPAWRAAAIDVQADGNAYVAVFAESGTLYREKGGRDLAGARQRLLALAGNEEYLEARLDSYGYLHAALLGGGALSYRNDAPAPHVEDFSIAPTEGEVPLAVQFEGQATGHVLSYRWEFGDGKYGSSASTEHAYAATGKYMVTCKAVGTAGVSHELVKADCVKVIPKRFHLKIPDLVIYDDQRIVSVPVKATTDTPVLGFTLAGSFDTTKMALLPGETFLDLTSTATKFLEAEFVAPSQNAAAGDFILGVVFDLVTPVTGKSLAPCRDSNLVNIVVELKGTFANRERIPFALEDGVGSPPTTNSFTIPVATTVSPELHPGSITIIRRAQEDLGRTFLRGDVNSDGRLGLNDAITLLGYLFAKGTAPRCMDAADIDDGGRVDIGDAIALLGSIFTSAISPAAPYPMPGLDPVADTLPACL